MSINVEHEVVRSGSDTYLADAWDLKELIRSTENVLKQRRGFFTRAYRRSTVYCYRDPTQDDLIGFAASRRDGYVLFLAVSPDRRGEGFGERLIAQVAENHRTVSCHARVTNTNAIGFYEYLGFEIIRRINSYYEDGGDAFYLRLGDTTSLTDRLASLFSR